MAKKIVYFLGTILLLFAIATIVGIKWFNDLWFKEQPNYLTYTHDSHPINFEWASGTYGDFVEPHEALIIPLMISGIPFKFYLQFDTGAPTTLIYGNTLKALQAHGLNITEIRKDDKHYIEHLSFRLGGSKIEMYMPQILESFGSSFDIEDSTQNLKLGTIGADFMDNRITLIDFKLNSLQLFQERPAWIAALAGFKSFDFTGRRFMLPARIDGIELELFYDSGSSAFGLITSKNRYEDFTDSQVKEIEYKANRFGESLPIHHKNTDKEIEIGNALLDLKRVSYVDMYANYQQFITPFTRIGGWLGNKPFTESTMILDTKSQEFIVIKSSPVP